MDLQDLIIDDTASIESNTTENTITIHAGDSSKRLSDVLTDFPDNCYVNKQITGCGGTTLVLRNNVDYVVLVPYVNLLISKQADNAGIVDLVTKYKDGDDNETISNYLEDRSRPRKILCTYDSLQSLLKVKGFNPKEFKLLVDEAHTLVNLGSFKASTCEYVLENYTLFGSYVLLTATPTKREYFPKRIEHLPLCIIEWDNVREVKFNLQRINKGVGVNNALFGLCYDYLTGKTEGNCHIFYNSVKEMGEVLGKLQKIKNSKGEEVFNPADIRIICADRPENLKSLKKNVDSKKSQWGNIGSITDPVAKVNMYSASVFEGTDIYDEDGQTYIIINGVRDSTKVDWHVSIPQIVGRIRDSKRNEHINLLVGNLPEAATVTKDQWQSRVTKRINDSNVRLNFLLKNKDMVGTDDFPMQIVQDLISKAIADNYIFAKKDYSKANELTIDDLYVSDVALKAELQAYEALEATYVVREIEGAEVSNEGYSATFRDLLTDESKHESFAHVPMGVAKLLNGSTQCFIETMKEYCEAKLTKNSFIYDLVDNKDEDYGKFYEKLGAEKIKALEYRKAEIELEYNQQCKLDNSDFKILDLLNLSSGDIVIKAELKTRLQEAYDKLNIAKVAKATEIGNWYEVKNTKLDNKPAFKIIKLLDNL
ncbi:hypothetical protein V6C59_20095 [Acinetobacter bereziniae]|uniref:hypothetical protein n=1 Tax=Acinetobacter bereziniae TaxID=106648 RepID=UPI002FD99475